MPTKEYDSENPVTMAGEPAVAYVSSSSSQTGTCTNHSATPPCQYTVEEMVQRVIQATADVDAGRGLMSHEEFAKLVRSWY